MRWIIQIRKEKVLKMNLIREECEKALKEIENATTQIEDFNSIPEITYNEFKNQLNVLNQLINEHFDNQPLKFEELKEKTWYWHEPSKSWIYLYKPLDWEPIKGLRYGERIINHSVEGYYMDFKEGTLFRKQVKE